MFQCFGRGKLQEKMEKKKIKLFVYSRICSLLRNVFGFSSTRCDKFTFHLASIVLHGLATSCPIRLKLIINKETVITPPRLRSYSSLWTLVKDQVCGLCNFNVPIFNWTFEPGTFSQEDETRFNQSRHLQSEAHDILGEFSGVLI